MILYRITNGWKSFLVHLNWLAPLVAVLLGSRLLGSPKVPLMVVAVVGSVVLGRWCLRHRRALLKVGRRAYPWVLLWHAGLAFYRVQWVRAKWHSVCAATNSLHAGTRKSPIVPWIEAHANVDLDVEAWTKSVRINVFPEDIMAARSRIRQAAEVKDLVVRNGDQVGVTLLKFRWSDALERVTMAPDKVRGPGKTKDGRYFLTYGMRADGGPAFMQASTSCLIGGLPEAGKSGDVWSLIEDAIYQDMPIHLYVSDAKFGVELQAFKDKVGKLTGNFKVMRYKTSAKDTVGLVEEVHRLMVERGGRQRKRAHRITEEEPLIVLLLDELLPLQEMLKKGVDSPLGEILFAGRAVGVVMWANAQMGQKTTIGDNRDIIPQRLCMRTSNSATTDTVLGDGATAAGAACHLIPIDKPGVGYSVDEQNYYARFRTTLITDEDIEFLSRGELAPGVTRGGQTEARAGIPQVAVYRLPKVVVDGKERPLYIGIAKEEKRATADKRAAGLKRRFRQHRREDFGWCPVHNRKEHWWQVHVTPAMEEAMIEEAVWYVDEPAARDVERESIRAEFPVFNYQHNRGKALRRRVRATVLGPLHRRHERKHRAPVVAVKAKWRPKTPVSPVDLVTPTSPVTAPTRPASALTPAEAWPVLPANEGAAGSDLHSELENESEPTPDLHSVPARSNFRARVAAYWLPDDAPEQRETRTPRPSGRVPGPLPKTQRRGRSKATAEPAMSDAERQSMMIGFGPGAE